jgi:4-hydroxy-4-methyl-2-oxoglutarate aldolase
VKDSFLLSREKAALWAQQSSATLHEAAGRIGALSSAIKPIAPGMRISGPAYPLQLDPGDNLGLHAAIYAAPSGSVLVIDAFDYLEAGPFGEIMATAAQARGLTGLLTTGSVRDRDAIAALGFAVFAKGLSIKGTAKNCPPRVGQPVVIDGIVINPHDMLLGDSDGVVVIPAMQAEQVLVAAIAREAKEADIMRRIRQGERTLDIYNFKVQQ